MCKLRGEEVWLLSIALWKFKALRKHPFPFLFPERTIWNARAAGYTTGFVEDLS
jgi:hypothetical protein